MHALNANEAKTQFGALLMKAQRTPVQINKNGKPVAVMVSIEEFENIEEIKRQWLQTRFSNAQQEIQQGDTADGDEFFSELLTSKYD
ncbi:type II toxin-antitoxin system Phd/YefM family antitoxin [Thiomicrospira microaerophila]|uniref:type II toxin-antitoxin system Phd/YefM family antitoxin n=1 Tax=Thiomicrospira microaerophila TaxID=406020 RepID=UPI00200F4272|nr:type II toxin-antitoxin system Phd/YefM family antitoxin [Thiomicrospira microaerophila]UQB41885.1 type II toxin-antitoxin system Phd/YefM family antitoxin [Thiomicrospira microaerophila]